MQRKEFLIYRRYCITSNLFYEPKPVILIGGYRKLTKPSLNTSYHVFFSYGVSVLVFAFLSNC